jgi:hypothetical protein
METCKSSTGIAHALTSQFFQSLGRHKVNMLERISADGLEGIGGLCASVGTHIRQPSTWIQVETGWTVSPRSQNKLRLTHIQMVEYLGGEEGVVLGKVEY